MFFGSFIDVYEYRMLKKLKFACNALFFELDLFNETQGFRFYL